MVYLITGATGNVGSLVAKRLIGRGVRPRIFVRDAAKARASFGDRAEIHIGDLGGARQPVACPGWCGRAVPGEFRT